MIMCCWFCPLEQFWRIGQMECFPYTVHLSHMAGLGKSRQKSWNLESKQNICLSYYTDQLDSCAASWGFSPEQCDCWEVWGLKSATTLPWAVLRYMPVCSWQELKWRQLLSIAHFSTFHLPTMVNHHVSTVTKKVDMLTVWWFCPTLPTSTSRMCDWLGHQRTGTWVNFDLLPLNHTDWVFKVESKRTQNWKSPRLRCLAGLHSAAVL